MKQRIQIVLFVSIIAAITFETAFLITTCSAAEAVYQEFKWNEEHSNPADRKISTLRELNNTFVEIAGKANDTVVTVFTEIEIKPRRLDNYRFFQNPYDRFSPDFYGQPQPPQQKDSEYRHGMGSGVIVSEDGYVLTNNHVVKGAEVIKVRLRDKRLFSAKVIGTDPKTDIAVLKIDEKGLPAIKFADSDKLQVGEWVLAIGSPLDSNLGNTVTRGIVSAVGRSHVGLAEYEDFIQTDAAINPGNSGGAMINLDGNLVGINTAIATRNGGFQGIGFAVPINMARNIMDAIIKHGIVIRGWIGVYLQDINDEMSKAMQLKTTNGALVGDVIDTSPADIAGIKEGDVITELNNDKITDAAELRNDIACLAPGSEAILKLFRNNNEINVAVKTGKLEVDRIAPETTKVLEDLFGFIVKPFTTEMAEKYNLDKSLKGVILSNVATTSIAAKAGLREGDLIVKINRKSMGNMEEFNSFVQKMKPGDSVYFQVIRENKGFFVAFTL